MFSNTADLQSIVDSLNPRLTDKSEGLRYRIYVTDTNGHTVASTIFDFPANISPWLDKAKNIIETEGNRKVSWSELNDLKEIYESHFTLLENIILRLDDFKNLRFKSDNNRLQAFKAAQIVRVEVEYV